MKKEEVPQYDENLLNGIKEIQYAVDENGEYTEVKSPGWEPKNIALKQALKLVDEMIEDARQLVINGEKSPVYFYMNLKQMDFSILKEETGFPKFIIKKHLKPSVFKKLSEKKLKKYASVFGISKEELLTVPEKPVKALEYNFGFKLKN
ncbi:MAG: hypothetical protein L3J56_08090 [Bacteroidales bacterium]|nr:hypothetical protein [Bacteroidales bacterium]